MCLAEDTRGDERHVRDADDEPFVEAPPSDDPACLRRVDLGSLGIFLAEEGTTGDERHVRDVFHAIDDEEEAFVEVPPSDGHGSLGIFLAEDTAGDGRDVRGADDEPFVKVPPSDDPACLGSLGIFLAEEDTTGDERHVPGVVVDAAEDDEAFVKAPPSDDPACLAEDTAGDERRHVRYVVDAADDEAFVKAPPSDDPACLRRVDKLRALVETWVEGVRAEAGRPALSAAMYRRRRAADHLDITLEFAQRRMAGLEDDELCSSVLDAMGAEVIGSCAYCGCNFSVVAVVDMPEVGIVCGVCGRRARVHDPAPPVPDPPADAEERWKGWLPW